MDVYIARQPIFNVHLKTYGYELLFRESMGDTLDKVSGSRATCSVLSSTFLTEGIEEIAGNKLSFINFTEELLDKNIVPFFPRNKIVVEILEDVPPSPRILTVCRNLVKLGYTLALDDFVFDKRLVPLIELAHIIKIDFRQLSMPEIERTLYRLSRFNVKLLAEKIETHEEFEKATRLGFSYFQGYFFSRPERLRIKEVPSAKISLLRLLVEVNKPSTTVDRLEEIVSSDVALTYKLLRYINSAYYYLLKEVESIRHALVYLGEKGVRSFVCLAIVSEMASNKPAELVRLALIRARFCEQLAIGSSHHQVTSNQLFLLGIFSLIDAILDTPMKNIVRRVPLGEDIVLALTEKKGPYAPYLAVVTSYEKKDAKKCLAALKSIGVEPHLVAPMYVHAVKFVTRVLS
ncbi:EAL and HDOD domain-containing protein [Desulfolithobacter sp.]